VRILIVHESYVQRGGEDAAVEADADLLRRNGHDVRLWSISNAEIEKWPLHRKVRLAWQTTWSSASRRRIKSLITEHRVDLVHFHNTLPIVSPSAIRAAHGRGVPVVMTLHNYRLVCPAGTLMRNGTVCEDCIDHSLARGIIHACYRGSRVQTASIAAMLSVHRILGTWTRCVDAFIALTPFMKSRLVAAGIPPARIHVRHNTGGAPPGGPSTGRTVPNYAVFSGRLSPEKGVLQLIEALENLRECRVLIAGGGPLEGRVREAAAGHPHLEYLGELPPDRARAILGDARVLVFPSIWYEGFPMTILEAFAAGVPVVASRIGGLPEIVTDGHDGFLVTPSCPRELARQVARIMSDPALQARMGRAARRTYEDRFTPRRSYEKLMEIYRVSQASPAGGRAA